MDLNAPNELPVCRSCEIECEPEAKVCPQCGEPVAPIAPDPLIGTMLDGKYKIDKKLGEGGMGSVYRAMQQPINRPVCLKVINPALATDPIAFRRFEQEAEMCAKVRHPAAVEIYDFVKNLDAFSYIVMEYVPGELLTDILKDQFPVGTERIVRLLSQVCDVLETGHRLKIVHRDLKPDNIMVSQLVTEKDVVKLLDFGIAKSSEQKEGATQLTMASTAVGTPEYMAPEQISGKQIGAHTDVYALGVILYSMLAGVLPFEGGTPAEFMTKHVVEQPIAPSKRGRVSGIHPELEKLTMWSLKKRPEERTPSAAEFKRSLMRALPSTTAAPAIGGAAADASGAAGGGAASLLSGILGAATATLGTTVPTFTEEKRVAVVCFDLAVPSDTSDDALNVLKAKVTDFVERHDGQMQTVGHGWIAGVFGLRSSKSDDIERAALCAFEGVQELPSASASVHVGMVKSVADEWSKGPLVAHAQRVATLAAGGQALVIGKASAEIQNLTLRALAPLDIKGSDEPLHTSEILGVVEADEEEDLNVISSSATVAAHVPPGTLISALKQAAPRPWVGRNSTLDAIDALIEKAAEGGGGSLLIEGAPGSGKTRTLDEVIARHPEMPCLRIPCRHDQPLAYLLQHLGQVPSSPELEPFVNWISGAAFEPPYGLGAEEIVRGILAGVRDAVTQAAGNGPLGLLFDDVDAASPAVRLVASNLASEAAKIGCVVVVTARDASQLALDATRHDLEPLSDEESSQLVSGISGKGPEVVMPWLQSAGGVPAALVQLGDALRETDLDAVEAGDDQALRAVVRVRLDALDGATRQLLSRAALLGPSMREEVLLEVASDCENPKQGIDDAMMRGILARDAAGVDLQFGNDLTREVAYERIAATDRAGLHRRAATALEDAGTPPDIVADHFEKAGDGQAALDRLRLAASMWDERKERERAITCYRRACAIAADLDSEASRGAEDALALARLLGEVGRSAEAADLLKNAEAVAKANDDAILEIQIATERVRGMLESNAFSEANVRVEQLLAQARTIGDPLLLSDLLGVAGEAAERDGRSEEASQQVIQAIGLIQQVPGDEGLKRAVRHLGRLGRIELRAGHADKAQTFFQQQQAAAKQVGDPLSEARATVNQSAVLMQLGDIDACLEKLAEGQNLARDIGDLVTVAKALHNRAAILAGRGDTDDAKKHVQESLDISLSIAWREGVAMNDALMRKLG
jgi:tRNA A-37 threonylcarbamoyl transferase component Bud32/tetratricopeptide (TPR) repeat protein